jgi:hypothetical protein
VDFFEQTLFPVLPRCIRSANERVPLGQLLNLHNPEGMRDVPQIRGMLRQIQGGADVLHATGLPNVKLVTTSRGEWVLFDGHHTTIAYMADGRRYLDELPHLMVHHHGWKPIPDSDILVVFGSHAPFLSTSIWRDYTINWQAPPEEQLAQRVQPSMRGLFDVLARNHTFLSPSRISIRSSHPPTVPL